MKMDGFVEATNAIGDVEAVEAGPATTANHAESVVENPVSH
jgi:hypothetical protein